MIYICLTCGKCEDESVILMIYDFRPSRFKQYSVIQQQDHETDANLAFTIPREFITCQDLTSGSLFHGKSNFDDLFFVSLLLFRRN